MMRPFNGAANLLHTAVPMGDLFVQLANDLAELRDYRQQLDMEMGDA